MIWLENYLSKKIPNLRLTGTGEVTGECPFCGKSIDHFYVHVEKDERWGRWNCFKCNSKGRDVWSLVSILENISKQEARRLYTSEVCGSNRIRSIKSVEKVDASLPNEYIPITHRLPKYLAERNVTLALAKRYNLGYCEKGRYANRIIFPIACPIGKSFAARATWKTKRKRYLNGPNAGHLIFGWDQAFYGSPNPLIIVEGAMDVMGIARAGFQAVAFMGHNFSGPAVKAKINLIRNKKVRTIVCFDSDSVSEGCDLAKSLGSKVAILQIGDPGDNPPEILINAIENASNHNIAKIKYLQRRALKNKNIQKK